VKKAATESTTFPTLWNF